MDTLMEDTVVRRHRITVDEYSRMAEVGLLAPDARVELIEGQIIDMAPIGTRHMSAVDRLTHWLVAAVGTRAIVRIQGSFRLSDITMPQPDVILLKPREDFYSSKTATGEDTLLVAEVSDTTLRYDLNVKVPLYARHQVPEVWVVDVEGGRVQFFRSLKSGSYADVSVSERPGITALPGLPGLTVDLSRLLEF